MNNSDEFVLFTIFKIESTRTNVPDRPIPEEMIVFLQKQQTIHQSYQHYNELSVDQTANQKHHYDEHHLIIQGMVQDYSVHHDQAIRNLTNELSNEIHLSK